MAANGKFCKIGSFQPYLTQGQLEWSTMMFIESPCRGYPTCLFFAHVVWWSTAVWMATTIGGKDQGGRWDVSHELQFSRLY